MINNSISPLDSRYKESLLDMSDIWSDFNMTKNKVKIEIEYFKFLCNNSIGILDKKDYDTKKFDKIYSAFCEEDYTNITDIERETKHDIKAVEYFVKRKLRNIGVKEHHLEYVHIGLTSQDIVSLSNSMAMVKSCSVIFDKLTGLFDTLSSFSMNNLDKIFIAKTHGQPAIPTSIGREMGVYLYRLQDYVNVLGTVPIRGKFGGAVGNLASMYNTFPKVGWEHFMSQFTMSLGVNRSMITTQTDNYETFCVNFDIYTAISSILIDFCRDIWQYISMEYFIINVDKSKFIGSSTMPQKINPILFENAEGNLEIAEMWFSFLSKKLRKSRLQRDLTDSTVVRNFGTAISHFYLAISYIEKGLKSIEVNESILNKELENGYMVLAEPIQNKLRSEGYTSAYEHIKKYFIGQKTMDKDTYADIMTVLKDEIKLDGSIIEGLSDLTPKAYYRDEFIRN